MIVKNIGKMRNISFLKSHKKSAIRENSSVWCFCYLSRRVCNHLYFNLIKTALKTLIFFKNDFLTQTSRSDRKHFRSTAKLKSLEMHISGQKFISTSWLLSQKKMNLKSGHLNLRFTVCHIHQNRSNVEFSLTYWCNTILQKISRNWAENMFYNM